MYATMSKAVISTYTMFISLLFTLADILSLGYSKGGATLLLDNLSHLNYNLFS